MEAGDAIKNIMELKNVDNRELGDQYGLEEGWSYKLTHLHLMGEIDPKGTASLKTLTESLIDYHNLLRSIYLKVLTYEAKTVNQYETGFFTGKKLLGKTVNAPEDKKDPLNKMLELLESCEKAIDLVVEKNGPLLKAEYKLKKVLLDIKETISEFIAAIHGKLAKVGNAIIDAGKDAVKAVRQNILKRNR